MSIITLLSDFGSASPYPAEVKGVLLSLCRATLVDITHDVPRHDILHAAFLLAAVAPAFPAGTVHLAVVDPGVGTERHPVAIASGGQFFVGPDNGVLMPAARSVGSPFGAARTYLIDARRFGRRPMAQTFHGRDLFAPAAAALANGLPVERLGAPLAAPVDLLEIAPQQASAVLRGQVRYRDPFGNVVTNIPGAWLTSLEEPLTLDSPGGRRGIRRVRTYGDGRPDELLVLVGSTGTVEIAVKAGSAADAVGLRPGDRIALLAGSAPR